MNYENYFKDMFESIPDYRKTKLLNFLKKLKIYMMKQTDEDLLKECGLSKKYINRLNKKFKNFLREQNKECLDHIKNEEEPIIGRSPNKKIEARFSNLSEDIRQ